MEAHNAAWDIVCELWPLIDVHAAYQAKRLGVHHEDLLDIAIEEACGIVHRHDSASGVPLDRWLRHCLALSYRRFRYREQLKRQRLINHFAVHTTSTSTFDAEELEVAQLVLSGLSKREREILLMRAVGASFGEIGKLFGVSAGTARLHYASALMRAQKGLAEHGL